MSQPHKHVRRTREQIEDLLDRFRTSGSTQAAFAKEQDLSVSTLRFWIARRRSEAGVTAPPSRFVPVSMTPPIEATGLELEFGEDRRLHIPPDIDADALARLLPIIVGAC